MFMDQSGRDVELKLLPTETQIKAPQTNGRSIRERKYSHTSRNLGHFILRQVKVIPSYRYFSKVSVPL